MKLFYTGKGDKGQSDLGGKKIDKSSIEIETVGSLDEINSLLGLARTQKLPARYKKILHNVQEDLFIIQANVGVLMVGKYRPPKLKEEKVRKLEKLIDEFEKKIKPERGFIVYGSNEASAWLDYARAVARRTEVTVVKLQKKTKKKLAPAILAYLNRLSSLLYAMARFAAKMQEKREKHPTYQ